MLAAAGDFAYAQFAEIVRDQLEVQVGGQHAVGVEHERAFDSFY